MQELGKDAPITERKETFYAVTELDRQSALG